MGHFSMSSLRHMCHGPTEAAKSWRKPKQRLRIFPGLSAACLCYAKQGAAKEGKSQQQCGSLEEKVPGQEGWAAWLSVQEGELESPITPSRLDQVRLTRPLGSLTSSKVWGLFRLVLRHAGRGNFLLSEYDISLVHPKTFTGP